MICQKRRIGDQYLCHACGLAWDHNDPEPPECAPVKKKAKVILEADIEKAVCDYAKSIGVLVYKFTSPARAAVPDRLFITPRGRVFFIEMKRPGARPTAAQERELARLRNANVFVFVVDNIDFGKGVIDGMMNK